MPVETGSCILAALRRFAELLAGAEDELNAINVFPVADRDTGTNLCRTMDRLLVELTGWDERESLGRAVGRAALEAARGNSGLICSQYLAAFVEYGDSSPTIDGGVLARCMEQGAVAARAAVAIPVEGTILTVADAAAAAAREDADRPLPEVACLAHRRSLAALDETPGQLAVLGEAGLVDAGAAGLVLFFEALASAVADGAASERTPSSSAAIRTDDRRDDELEPTVSDGSTSSSVIDGVGFVGFELQFTAEGPAALAEDLRVLLCGLGTDVVVSSAQGLVRAHVHAAVLGPVLEAVIERTRPRNIVVEALMESTEP